MIDSLFIQVKTKANFESQLESSQINDSAIAFIEDTSEIWAKGKYYPCPYTAEQIAELLKDYLPLSGGTMTGSITFKADANVGDAVLYDSTQNKLVIVPTSDTMNEQYPAERYTPIGVVVIPSSHDVYGDGSCGVMSLKAMNCDTPSTGGTSEQYMYWGGSGDDISLPNLDQVPTGNTSNGIPTGQTSFAFLPSDKFSGTQCAHDTDAYYYSSSSCIPSPYLTDGSRNPGYYQTSSPSSSNNALADFDGIGNTEKIITQRGTKDYNSWTPGRTTEADYPAASCCDMFHTEGTQQGDWYLPACGELGYIMPPFNKINDAIDKMRTAYGSSVGVELSTGSGYWSSTEYSTANARYVYTSYGRVHDTSKNFNYYVRAFLRVKPSLGIIIPGKTSNDLLNAAGGTTSIDDLGMLELGETSSTAFAGDRGKAVEDTLDALNTDLGLMVMHGAQWSQEQGDLQLNLDQAYRDGVSKDFTDRYIPIIVPTATSEHAGAMSASDKQKLDNLHEPFFIDIHLIDKVSEEQFNQLYDLANNAFSQIYVQISSITVRLAYAFISNGDVVLQIPAGYNGTTLSQESILISHIDYSISITDSEINLRNYGDGTKFLSDDGTYKEITIPSGGIPVETEDTEVLASVSATLDPNKFYRWNEVGSLTILSLSSIGLQENKLAEYMFEFKSGDTPTVLTLPEGIKWIGSSVVEPNKTYQVSIINNLAVMGGA